MKRSDKVINDQLDYYADTYEKNRDDFRNLLGLISNYWPGASLQSFPVETGEEDLTIDLIKTLPLKENKHLLFLSCGLHGIEGYIGAAILKLFVNEFLTFLNPHDTGLYLVHSINPWGMKHRRRVNENNVDLNRNFILKEESIDQTVNPAYSRAHKFLNPTKPLRSKINPYFYLNLIHLILCMGPANFREAFFYGQYRFPKGLYYGGKGFERSAEVVDNLFREAAANTSSLLLVDMHSGYGPRYQMTMVNSIHEKRESEQLKEAFNYPLVAKADPEEFYQMKGDMIDYFYRVIEQQFPGKYFYGTSFEFGTHGSSFSAVIRSLKAMINENRLFQNGAERFGAKKSALKEFSELFFPDEERWRSKALQDARQAFFGMFKAESIIN
jgi:hypothetical protein